MPRKKIVDAAINSDIPAETAAQLAPTSPLTNDELVAEHFRIDDYIDVESKRFTEFLKPLKERDEEIKKILHGRMLEQGMPSIKTDHGTAYKSTIMTPKVVDRDAYLREIMNNWTTFGAGMLQVGTPQKSAFEEYVARRQKEIEEFMAANNGQLPPDTSVYPPGVDASSFTRVNIRRT